jgi:DNA-binding response OmpR family regulator
LHHSTGDQVPTGREQLPVRVLLVGGYRPLVTALKRGLEEEGYALDVADDLQDGDCRVPMAGYDAIVLDLTRPAGAGLALLRGWRRAGLRARVLVLTAPGGSDGNARGPDPADDWLSKPFALDELLARLRALVRPP